MSDFDFLVVGAGPTGLTLTNKLLEGGKSVCLAERFARPGGLAKSYKYGNNIFDLGPKRFHTDDKKVGTFIDSVLSLDLITRSTFVCFYNRYLDWPLRRRDLFKLPPSIAVRSAVDIFSRPEPKDLGAFTDYIISKYGNTLFKTFFAPYTEKFLNTSVGSIHSDWASTGINRAVVDAESNKNVNSSLEILKSLALPKKVETLFKYPSVGGFGEFFDVLYANCEINDNFSSIFNSDITAIDDHGDYLQCVINGKSISANKIIWTGNLNDLRGIINQKNTSFTEQQEEIPLQYLNTRFIYLTIKESSVISKNTAQWIYVSDPSISIARITCMREFNPNTCDKGYYNVICEVTFSQDLLSKDIPSPNNSGLRAINELKQIGFIKNIKGVEDMNIVDMPDTYPIYTRDYKKRFALATKAIKSYSKNIHLLGRSGAFWYNNSDHSIRQALDASEYFLGKSEQQLDYRSYFGGQHSD